MSPIKQYQRILPNKPKENILDSSCKLLNSIDLPTERQEDIQVLEPKYLNEERSTLARKQGKTSLEDKLEIALYKTGMSEDVIADKLNDIMLNAITTTPKGDVIPDYKAMLEAIKVRHKFRRR